MTHTRIPDDELAVFKSLKDIKVVFDVGSRDDVDYLILKPGIKLHAFEPNPVFFKELKENVGKTRNVYLNNFGLGDVEGRFEYIEGSQAISDPKENGVLIRRMDNYIREKRIKRVDFLKIDTEGYDERVLRGAGEKIKMFRYIQYESSHTALMMSDEISKFLQGHGFAFYYIGGRNVFCVRQGEEVPWIPSEPKEGGLTEKGPENYLRHENN